MRKLQKVAIVGAVLGSIGSFEPAPSSRTASPGTTSTSRRASSVALTT